MFRKTVLEYTDIYLILTINQIVVIRNTISFFFFWIWIQWNPNMLCWIYSCYSVSFPLLAKTLKIDMPQGKNLFYFLPLNWLVDSLSHMYSMISVPCLHVHACSGVVHIHSHPPCCSMLDRSTAWLFGKILGVFALKLATAGGWVILVLLWQ